MFGFRKIAATIAVAFLGSMSMAHAEMGYKYPICQNLDFYAAVQLNIQDNAVLSGQIPISVNFASAAAGYWSDMPLLVDGQYVLNYAKQGSRTRLSTQKFANGSHVLTMIINVGPGDGSICEVHDSVPVVFQN